MAMTHDAQKMSDAMVERPAGSTLSERVGECLRSRVIGTRAAGEVCGEIRALDPALALRFWNMFGRPTRNDELRIVEIIEAVRALEPKPQAPAPREVPPGVPATFQPADPLSDYLEETYRLPAVG